MSQDEENTVERSGASTTAGQAGHHGEQIRYLKAIREAIENEESQQSNSSNDPEGEEQPRNQLRGRFRRANSDRLQTTNLIEGILRVMEFANENPDSFTDEQGRPLLEFPDFDPPKDAQGNFIISSPSSALSSFANVSNVIGGNPDIVGISQRDNAGGGYCAKGVANIIQELGMPIVRGNAHDWRRNLGSDDMQAAGWRFVSGGRPEEAPLGSVLFFDSDLRDGDAARNNGGGKYGHVEIPWLNNNGDRVYVSDKARDNWGGSVPDNYEGYFVFDPDNNLANTLAPSSGSPAPA